MYKDKAFIALLLLYQRSDFDNEVNKTIWKSILTCEDLHFRIMINPLSNNNHYSYESYNPFSIAIELRYKASIF